jgi:oxygen-independent coproporphyrinogen-3 oxidase
MVNSIYIHVPFCLKKCPYCDFYSCVGTPDIRQTYLQALEQEMINVRDWVEKNKLETLYIGGGTPTALESRELEKLLELCREYLLPSGLSGPWEGEFTVEVNPATIQSDKCRLLLEQRVNRVSLGAQSFDGSFLKILGRAHNVSDIHRSVKLLRDAGFENLNIDLMFGLPGQSPGEWRDNLEKGLEMAPEHISVYNLTLAEGTPFYRNPPSLPTEDDQIEMMEITEETLKKSGYRRYEISNYARPQMRSRHNTAYWEGKEYLGLGPGAHSYRDGVRWGNIASVEEYNRKLLSDNSPTAFSEKIDFRTKASEALMLGLRMPEGVLVEVFENRFGDSWEEKIESFLEEGILEREFGKVRFTRRGMLVSDTVLTHLI